MPTRIKLSPSQISAAMAAHAPQQAFKLLALPAKAPPTGLGKRLATTARRVLPGWTFRITVRVWTNDLVVVLIDGTRDPASGAPVAPPHDSPAVATLKSRTASALDTILETLYPNKAWTVFPDYVRRSASSIWVTLVAIAGKDDPPTCADGEVIFPGAGDFEGQDKRIRIDNDRRTEKGGKPIDRRVFFRWHLSGTPATLPAPLLGPNVAVHKASASLTGWWPLQSTLINPPALMHNGSLVPLGDQITYALLLAANGSLKLDTVEVSDWWVWWDPI